jgi:hypothetical protein
MIVSRAGLIRGLAAGTLALPFAASAKVAAAGDRFRADLPQAGARPWTALPALGSSPLRFAVIGDHTGLARPGVFEQGLRQVSWLQPDFILSVDVLEAWEAQHGRIPAGSWVFLRSDWRKIADEQFLPADLRSLKK